MFPGMNPRQMQAAMKKLGMKQEEIEASEVIIKTKDQNIIIRNPQVSKVNMMGQDSIQVIGEMEYESAISEEDINTVAEQAKVSKEKAAEALKNNSGDLAAAILELQE